MDILVGLGATKTGLDLIKSVRELLKGDKINRPEILEKLNTLQEALYQAREALADAQELNRTLTREIEDNKRLSDIGADMEYVHDGGFYVRKSEKAAGRSIPYCPLCWSLTKAAVPLNPVSGEGFYHCNIHKSTHETSVYRSSQNTRYTPSFDEL